MAWDASNSGGSNTTPEAREEMHNAVGNLACDAATTKAWNTSVFSRINALCKNWAEESLHVFTHMHTNIPTHA